MNDTSAALAVLTGLTLRMAVPVLVTAVIVIALARLDRRWQLEATGMTASVQKPKCWKTQHCDPEARANCPAFASRLPCWQVFRSGNGYLDQKCLDCAVLAAAPIPQHG